MDAGVAIAALGIGSLFAFRETRRRHVLAGQFSVLCVMLQLPAFISLTWRAGLGLSAWGVCAVVVGGWLVFRLVYASVPLLVIDGATGNLDYARLNALRVAQPTYGVIFVAAAVVCWSL